MAERKSAFEGLRVADFAWVGVGPTVSKYLADHGAEVIRIESATYPETLRRGRAVRRRRPRARQLRLLRELQQFEALHLREPETCARTGAREAADRRVRRGHGIVHPRHHGAVRAVYEELRAVREDILMISMPLYGADRAVGELLGLRPRPPGCLRVQPPHWVARCGADRHGHRVHRLPGAPCGGDRADCRAGLPTANWRGPMDRLRPDGSGSARAEHGDPRLDGERARADPARATRIPRPRRTAPIAAATAGTSCWPA